MPLLYSDLLDIMQQRMERLGLVDEDSGQADSTEAALYLLQALLDIVEIADIPAYTYYERALAVTMSGKQDYPLPENFGRMLLPRVRNRRGFYVFDMFTQTDLEYLDPNSVTRKMSPTLGKPMQFTIIGSALWLYPIPDANAASNYTVRGTYIEKVERPELTDRVVLPYPTALVDVALYRLGSDMGKDVSILAQQRQESLTRLAQGSR